MIALWDRERWLDEAYDARNDELDVRCPDCDADWPVGDEDTCPRCGYTEASR